MVSPYIWDGLRHAWRATHGEPCEECLRQEYARVALAETKAATLHRYRLNSGRYGHMALDSFRPDPRYPSQTAAKEAVQNMIAAWAGGDWSSGILLSGSAVGIGKTHLAIAAAREGVMLARPEVGQRLLSVWDMPSFIGAVKGSYDDGGTSDLLTSVQEPLILVLDDIGTEHIGKESQTWYQGLLYQIVNARWLAQRATLITTNLTLDDLWAWVGPRVLSRLSELTGPPVPMDGEDYRLKPRGDRRTHGE